MHIHAHDVRSDDLVYGEWKETHTRCLRVRPNRAGLCRARATTTTISDWVRLGVTFTTRRSRIGVECAIVISLEGDGNAATFWNDVTFNEFPAR